jgi:hypothetical protein
MAQTFQDHITSERTRLTSEREAILAKRSELDAELAEITREFKAIEAYEAAKSGKASRQSGPRATGTRRGSKRDGILAALADVPHGLSRGELLEKLGLKGIKSGEMSVSNALTALTKTGKVVRNAAKKYVASMG